MFKIKINYKYFLLGMIIIGAVYYKFYYTATLTTSTTDTTSTIKVEKGDMKNSIEVSWESELVDEQSLKFNKEWTITKVNLKAGDTVKKWSVIAELDSSDVLDSIEEAKLNLENAQLSYDALFDDPEKSQILQAENSLNQAENNYNIALKELENLKTTQANSINNIETNIENSKKDLESSKSSLELAKKELETTKKEQENTLWNTVSNKSTTVQNIEDSFKTNLVDIEKIIEQADYIMWVTSDNKSKNDSYENFLWVRNLTIKDKASASLLESISLYNKLKISVEDYDYSWDKEKIISLLNKFIDCYERLSDTTDYIYKTLENSVESAGVFTSSDIDSKKSTMSSYRSSALSKVSSLNSSKNTLNTLTNTDLVSESNSNTIRQKEESIKNSEISIEKKEKEIEHSEKELETTKESYKITLESKEKDIESKKRSVELAKINLEELYDWPTDETIRKADNSIKQAELKLESAYESLEDYKLIAPFNWVVRKIDYMIWDNITNDTDKYVYIENPDLLEITVMLDQIDITKVKLNQDANVTFDSYSTTPVKAKISTIDTQPVETSWVVSYTVKLVLDDDSFDKKILSWMSAEVEIIIESKEDVLKIDTSAITEKDGKKYLTILKDWKETETEIVTWITADWMTEIVSWVSEWDEVVIKEFTASTWSTDTSTSLFGPWSNRNSSSKSSSSSSSKSSNNFWPPGF